jgi:hypothetical protein
MRALFYIIVFTFSCNLCANEQLQSVKELQRQIKALEIKVEKMESVHKDALTHYIKNEVNNAIKQRNLPLLNLSSNVENLQIKGDLRLRFQREEFNTDSGASQTESRDRFRMRFRLGFIWKTNEGWEIGAGFATGDPNNPYNGRSTNFDVGNRGPFNSADLVLDYAFARHKWMHSDSTSTLTLGQMKNPYYTSPSMWDSDLRPTGIYYEWRKNISEETDFFVKAGAFTVVHHNSGRGNNDTNLYAIQTGLKNEMYTLSLGYHHYTGDLYESLAGVTSNAGASMDYRLLELYSDYTFHMFDYKWKSFVHVMHNLSAKGTDSHFADITSQEDTSYILGLNMYYNPKLTLAIQYRHMEAHAQPSNLVEGTFGSNQAGSAFIVSYKVTKNMTVKLNYLYSEEIASSASSADKHDSFVIDVIYKF